MCVGAKLAGRARFDPSLLSATGPKRVEGVGHEPRRYRRIKRESVSH